MRSQREQLPVQKAVARPVVGVAHDLAVVRDRRGEFVAHHVVVIDQGIRIFPVVGLGRTADHRGHIIRYRNGLRMGHGIAAGIPGRPVHRSFAQGEGGGGGRGSIGDLDRGVAVVRCRGRTQDHVGSIAAARIHRYGDIGRPGNHGVLVVVNVDVICTANVGIPPIGSGPGYRGGSRIQRNAIEGGAARSGGGPTQGIGQGGAGSGRSHIRFVVLYGIGAESRVGGPVLESTAGYRGWIAALYGNSAGAVGGVAFCIGKSPGYVVYAHRELRSGQGAGIVEVVDYGYRTRAVPDVPGIEFVIVNRVEGLSLVGLAAQGRVAVEGGGIVVQDGYILGGGGSVTMHVLHPPGNGVGADVEAVSRLVVPYRTHSAVVAGQRGSQVEAVGPAAGIRVDGDIRRCGYGRILIVGHKYVHAAVAAVVLAIDRLGCGPGNQGGPLWEYGPGQGG